MSLNFKDYELEFENLPSEVKQIFADTFLEAAEIMSPIAMRSYIDGCNTLCQIDRGTEVATSYLQEVPRVVKICGENIISDSVDIALKLSYLTSGKNISLVFNTFPIVALRLSNSDHIKDYFTLLHEIASASPRGLLPILKHIDELLSKLTLNGLRNWAKFGIHAYRRDYTNLTAYFNLQTRDSLAVLQNERQDILFINAQRYLNFYLRALWGCQFVLQLGNANSSPFIEKQALHFPDALDDMNNIRGLDVFRAMAAHMAAHICYSSSIISPKPLSPEQKFFTGIMEDARIEFKAIQQFPGLKKLWQSLIEVSADNESEYPEILYLDRIALMLIDDRISSDDYEISAFTKKFHELVTENSDNNDFSLRMGLDLYNLLSSRGNLPEISILDRYRIPYRDDNRFIWEHEQQLNNRSVGESNLLATKYEEILQNKQNKVLLVNKSNKNSNVNIGDKESLLSANASKPYHYNEWDYQIHLHRPDWVSLYEKRQVTGNSERINSIISENKLITQRIKRIIDMLSQEGVRRIRNLEDGNEIDINAAVDAMISLQMGEPHDPRITMQNIVNKRDISVLILMDLSESTNEIAQGTNKSVLQLTQEAVTLLATAIEGINDPFAIHGFASNGRHDVQYFRFKDFFQHFDNDAKSSLAGMQGGLSTRMGAAMRHAAHHLLAQPERKKLLLVVTDGEPADIDEHDPQTLRHDAKKAVEEIFRKGVISYCLTLDPNADDYVKRIFGANNYTIIDNVARLPEKLPMIFATLTH